MGGFTAGSRIFLTVPSSLARNTRAVETTLAPEMPARAPRFEQERTPVRAGLAAWLVWLFVAGNAVAIVWLWFHGGNVDGCIGRRGADEHRPDHRPSRRLPRAHPGDPARAPPCARAAGRLRPAHRLAPLERPRLPRPRPRARRLRVWGYALHRQVPARQGDLDDARRRHLPRDDHRDDRHRALRRRRRDLARDRPAAAPLRVVVRRAPARLRGDRARRGSTRSRPATSSSSTRSPPTTGARSTSPRSRCSSCFRLLRPARERAPLPAARRRGRRGGAGRRLAADHRPRARPPAAPAPGSSSSGASSTRGRWWRRIRSRSPRRPTGARCASPSRRSATTRRASRDPARHARRSPRGRSASSPTALRRREQGAADRRRHRHHADPRAGRGACAATSSSIYRGADATRTSIFRDELERARRERGVGSHYVVGDHATGEGARLLSRRATCASSCPTSPSATSTSAARPR